MARIRSIKPQFFTSEDIAFLSPLARLLFIALWCEADREGRMEWKPRTFRIRYLPVDNCDIEKVCDEIISRGLIVIYGDRKEFACIPTFLKHQRPHPSEGDSKLPPPPGEEPRETEHQGAPRGVPRCAAQHGEVEVEVEEEVEGKRKGKEGKGKEAEEEEEPPLPLDSNETASVLAKEFRDLQVGKQPIGMIATQFDEVLRSETLQEDELRTEIHRAKRYRKEPCWDLINRLVGEKRNARQSRPVGSARLGGTDAELRRFAKRDDEAANAAHAGEAARNPDSS